MELRHLLETMILEGRHGWFEMWSLALFRNEVVLLPQHRSILIQAML